MAVYYNEIDRKAAAWLRELIKAGIIAPGEVDERDIRLVRPSDLAGFQQCHFFAGIGGWSFALRLAGWPDHQPVWTGSCPCQPFSSAGTRLGTEDPRHLWPQFRRLIRKCRPATVFGEQVASFDGRKWLSGVFADLEAVGYRAAGADLCAAGVGAPHPRQRLFWVADTERTQRRSVDKACRDGWPDGLPQRQEGSNWIGGGRQHGADRMAYADVPHEYGRPSSGEQSVHDESSGAPETLGDATSSGPQGEWGEYRPSGEGCSGLVGYAMQAGVPQWNGPTIALRCTDGSRRASAESGAFPMAYGLPARMGRLRGFGNAIVPQVAAKFIEAYRGAA